MKKILLILILLPVFSFGQTFNPLGQTNRNWFGMTAHSNGNVYASVYPTGDIYMQTNGTGAFVALGQTNRDWVGMAVHSNGNVYAGVYNGGIYMQTSGTGEFVTLAQTNRLWQGMAAHSNGNVYACVYGGDIYMQTNGTGTFVALNQTNRNWIGMAAHSNGNVYAAVYPTGDIYMQTNGTGTFVALNQTNRDWWGMTAHSNGDVYAVVYNGGGIYMQTNGTGSFVTLTQTNRNWIGMAAHSNGNVYAAVYGGDIYMQTSVLPVLFTFFNLKCEGNKILINWKTAQEQNSSYFNVERSTDAVLWTVMGTLPAAGNSTTEKSYLFTDNNPVQKSFYRIAQYDINGSVKYTSILRSSCNLIDVFNVWPNPVTDMVNINITAGNQSQAIISVFDSKGTLVKKETATLLSGNNLLTVYLKGLAAGSYQLSVEWNNGQLKKAVLLIKQ